MVYLNIPYKEKNIAFRLGAYWDSKKNKCYVSKDRNINLFKQWIDIK